MEVRHAKLEHVHAMGPTQPERQRLGQQPLPQLDLAGRLNEPLKRVGEKKRVVPA